MSPNKLVVDVLGRGGSRGSAGVGNLRDGEREGEKRRDGDRDGEVRRSRLEVVRRSEESSHTRREEGMGHSCLTLDETWRGGFYT
jgi:hypothetical protein